MTENDNQKWLNALAGKPDSDADPITNAQAKAVRLAMIARRASLEQDTKNADPAEFARLQARLQREGLVRVAEAHSKQGDASWLGTWWGKWFRSSGQGATQIPRWSLAVNMVLAVIVVAQSGLFGSSGSDSEVDVVRGGLSTVLLVTNPEARLAELTSGLNAVNAHYVVRRRTTGVLHLIVQEDKAAFDYFDTQRIEPKWTEGVAVIELRVP